MNSQRNPDDYVVQIYDLESTGSTGRKGVFHLYFAKEDYRSWCLKDNWRLFWVLNKELTVCARMEKL